MSLFLSKTYENKTEFRFVKSRRRVHRRFYRNISRFFLGKEIFGISGGKPIYM